MYEWIEGCVEPKQKGVFTTARVEEGQVLWLNSHLDRLRNHASFVGLGRKFDHEEVIDFLYQKAERGMWRLRLALSSGGRKMTLSPYAPPQGPVRLCLIPDIERSNAHIKSFAIWEREVMRDFAKDQGFDDALTATQEGILLEATYANIFWIVDEVLFTPDVGRLPLFEGLCLQNLAQGRKIERVVARLIDIPNRARVFICNALMGPVPVGAINARRFSVD